MLIEILLSLIALLLCIFEYVVKYGRIGKYIDLIPGPKSWPILGSLPHFIFPRLVTPGKFRILLKYIIYNEQLIRTRNSSTQIMNFFFFLILRIILMRKFSLSEIMWKTGREWDIKYFPIYKFWGVNQPVAIILHPDDLEVRNIQN